ncbi:MAG: thioredoxin family protein [Bacteroidetes bacterium]|nr:thioredoxin family protein [Bacteroidota bacterium]MBU1718176.1 thioredoxin family protein [Bacteroidota bacterium]
MKKISTLIVSMMVGIALMAQTTPPSIYDVEADAKSDVKAAIEKAAKEGKHVLLQVGGNWCPWCIKVHQFIHDDKTVDSLITADYIFQLVNYSKENKNLEVMEMLGYPQRFGFPVFVILDGTGKVLHIQDSGYLEADKSYDTKKIQLFLKNWNRKAVDPESYKAKMKDK